MKAAVRAEDLPILEAVRKHLKNMDGMLHRGLNPDSGQVEIAKWVILHTLGSGWIKKHINDRYFSGKGIVEQFQKQDAFTRLAETILNLRRVPGAKERIASLRGKGLHNIMSELQAAAILFRNRIEFQFVKPLGKSGQDYDIQIAADGLEIACEVTEKLPQTRFSNSTITGTLRKKNRQVPRDNPYVVMLRLPREWLSDDHHPTVKMTINEVFQRYDDLAGVIIYSNVWKRYGNVGAISADWHACLINDRIPDRLPSLWSRLNGPSSEETKWLSLDRLFFWAFMESPLPGERMYYYGDVSRLKARAIKAPCKLIVDITLGAPRLCDFAGRRSVAVRLPDGPISEFNIHRKPASDSEWQLQFDLVPARNGARVAIEALGDELAAIEKSLQPNKHNDAIQDFVRHVFHKMRLEGDLMPDPFKVVKMETWISDGRGNDQILSYYEGLDMII